MVAGERTDVSGIPCLHYICNNCGYIQRCEQPCVFKVSFKAESRQCIVFLLKTRSILNLYEDDMINDPTLSRDENIECESCHQEGCVFFQAHGDGDDAMALVFMCIHCKHRWIG